MKIPNLKLSIPILNGRSVQLPPKQRAVHYATPEHIAWSRAVIREAHGQCQRCGRTNTRLFADHIRELRDGGDAFSIANGQALCGSCHTNKTMIERVKRAAQRW